MEVASRRAEEDWDQEAEFDDLLRRAYHYFCQTCPLNPHLFSWGQDEFGKYFAYNPSYLGLFPSIPVGAHGIRFVVLSAQPVMIHRVFFITEAFHIRRSARRPRRVPEGNVLDIL